MGVIWRTSLCEITLRESASKRFTLINFPIVSHFAFRDTNGRWNAFIDLLLLVFQGNLFGIAASLGYVILLPFSFVGDVADLRCRPKTEPPSWEFSLTKSCHCNTATLHKKSDFGWEKKIAYFNCTLNHFYALVPRVWRPRLSSRYELNITGTVVVVGSMP